MPLVDQISSAGFRSQSEAMLAGEVEHLLYCLTPFFTLRGELLVYPEGFEGAENHLLGRLVASRAKVPLDQVLSVGIEMNLHAGSASSIPTAIRDPGWRCGAGLPAGGFVAVLFVEPLLEGSEVVVDGGGVHLALTC